MAFLRLGCVVGASLVLVGCTQTPTSPSRASLPPVTAPASSAITVTPPRALGVTRFAAFGDSITWGATSAWDARFMSAAANGGYPERLQANLNTTHAPQQFTVFNEGLPGETAVSALTRFRSVLTNRRPQTVLLLEGINDLANGISISQAIGGLRQMLDAAAAVGVPVLIATMYQTYAEVDPDGNYRPNGAAMVPAFNTEVRRLAAGRLNVYLVDLEPLMQNRTFVGGDGIHLEDAGFDVVATAFRSVIEAAFPVRGSFQ